MRRMDRESENKANLYLILGILGLVLAAVAKFLPAQVWNKAQIGAVIGVGAGLFGFGLVKWWVERWNEKNPEIVKQNEIERKDERNQLIRSKAQALSGEILHWLLMGGAWAAIILDAPLWVTLAFVGVFLLKTVLDLAFIAYYQRRM